MTDKGTAFGDEQRAVLVTFATGGTRPFLLAQKILSQSALLFGGVAGVAEWNDKKLKQEDFYSRFRHILDQQRGAGYWLWKPYIIRKELLALNPGDYVVYSDCSTYNGEFASILRPFAPLLELCDSGFGGFIPGVYIPHWGPAKIWTKRDCFVLMDCDSEVYWETCQIQASLSVWKHCDESIGFLTEWLDYCQDERILSDLENTCGLPNFPEFYDHRHDQSVLTLLAHRHNRRALGNPEIEVSDGSINIEQDKVMGLSAFRRRFGSKPLSRNTKSWDSVLNEIFVPYKPSFCSSLYKLAISLLFKLEGVAMTISKRYEKRLYK